jgi:hypothetical protein
LRKPAGTAEKPLVLLVAWLFPTLPAVGSVVQPEVLDMDLPMSCPPEVNAKPLFIRKLDRVIHSASDGTCIPVGQTPAGSVIA